MSASQRPEESVIPQEQQSTEQDSSTTPQVPQRQASQLDPKTIKRVAEQIQSLVRSRKTYTDLVAQRTEEFNRAFESYSAFIATKSGKWSASLSGGLDRMNHQIDRARYQLSEAFTTLCHNQSLPEDRPPIENVIAEIKQLENEFENVKLDPSLKTISVTTEKIKLKVPEDGREVQLGAFELIFHYRNGLIHNQVSAKAIDPVYPNAEVNRNSKQYPHPHISGNVICLGEAQGPMKRAIEAGRIADYFLIIHAVLCQYNPSSPHYRLEYWDRISCQMCGASLKEEDATKCSYCPTKLCPECTRTHTCAICKKIICNSHKGLRKVRRPCIVCGKYICERHMESKTRHKKCLEELEKRAQTEMEEILIATNAYVDLEKRIREQATTQAPTAAVNNTIIDDLRTGFANDEDGEEEYDGEYDEDWDNDEPDERVEEMNDVRNAARHPNNFTGPSGWA